MANVQIAVATDMRMFEPTLTAMMSAVEHSSRPVTVHFLGHSLSNQARHMLNTAIQRCPQTELRFHDMSEILSEGANGFEWNGRHSATMRATLHIPKLVDGGKVLYLDSDTITQADIAPLFDIDMNGCHIAAVRDYDLLLPYSEFRPKGLRTAIAKALLHLVSRNNGHSSIKPSISAGRIGKFESILRYYSTGKNTPYASNRRLVYPYPIYDFPNAGVMVFDVDSIKGEQGLVDALNNPIGLYEDTNRIIELMKGRIFILDPCWNAICGIYHLYSQVHEAMVLDGSRYVHEDAKIVHYLGIEKPWHDYSLDDLHADPQKVRKQVYSDLNLEAHGHPISAVFHNLKDQKCIEEYCTLTTIWRETHDRYYGNVEATKDTDKDFCKMVSNHITHGAMGAGT